MGHAAPGLEIERQPGFLRVKTDIPSAIFNAVLETDLDERAAEEAIAGTKEYFQSKGLPSKWWVYPAARPSNLRELLLRHGYRHMFTMPGMAADLTLSRPSLPPLNNFEVKEMEHESEVDDYLVAMGVFNMPEEVLAAYSHLTQNFSMSRRSGITSATPTASQWHAA